MGSVQYQAFELYCLEYRDGGKRRIPSGLTFDSWIKTSAHVQEYIEKARQAREDEQKFQRERGWKR